MRAEEKYPRPRSSNRSAKVILLAVVLGLAIGAIWLSDKGGESPQTPPAPATQEPTG